MRPYRSLPFRDLPFPRFGLKKPRHRSQKPYRFPFFKEKRLPKRNKKTSFSVSVSVPRQTSVPCSVFSLKSANRTVQSSLPYSVRILYREPYRSKKPTVFRFKKKREPYRTKKHPFYHLKKKVNGPYFGTVRAFLP